MNLRSGEQVGSGGYGHVFAATEITTGENYAIKKLKVERAGEPESRRRFEREVRFQRKIVHPNVMPILAMNFEVTPPWYVMPLAKSDLVMPTTHRKGDPEFIEDVFSQVLEGIRAAHSEGIIHRDVNPRNVLQLDDGRWVVSDFGVGRHLDRTTTTVTHDAGGIGTLDYMAPEQYSDPHTTDRRADIFALGKLLFYMITGEVKEPFRPSSMPAHVFGHIVDRATQLDPAHRYQSVDEMLKAFAIARTAQGYVSPNETYRKLSRALRAGEADASLVNDVVEFLTAHADREAFFRSLVPYLPMNELTLLRAQRESSFQDLLSTYDQHVAGGLEFQYCDVVADFYRTLSQTFGDVDLFRLILRRLLLMGKSHNRFHVRDVVVSLLSGSLSQDRVAVAVELLEANPEETSWAFEHDMPTDMAPAIRSVVEAATAPDEEIEPQRSLGGNGSRTSNAPPKQDQALSLGRNQDQIAGLRHRPSRQDDLSSGR